MATLITRLYDTEKSAAKAASSVIASGVPDHDVSVVAAKGEATATTGGLIDAGLTKGEAQGYVERIEGGAAMVIVRAPYGRALKTEKALAGTKPIDQGFQRSTLSDASSKVLNKKQLLKGNKRYLSSDRALPLTNEGPVFSNRLGLKLLSDRKPKNVLLEGSKKIFPGKTLSSWSFNSSVGHSLISTKFGWPTLSFTRPRVNLETENTTPFSSFLKWPTIIRRDVR